jgi:hypothetical protein
MFHIHKWSKWTQYIAYTFEGYKPTHVRQSRYCLKCEFVEDEAVAYHFKKEMMTVESNLKSEEIHKIINRAIERAERK